MSLFQPAPRTPEEIEHCKPLDIPPEEVQELTEAEWYRRVYRGDVPQLTVRAVLMGSILGFLLAFTNLYIGLKAGWALGVVITAALMCFAIWRGLLAVGLAKSPMGVLEMNCMASTASSAGYATGGTMVSAIAALLMLSATEQNQAGEHIPIPVLLMWTGFLGFLGTVMAIPLKRNLINQERLRFPTGTAAAVTIQSLFSEGGKAMRKAKALFISTGLSTLFPLLLALQFVKEVGADGKARFRALLPDSSKVFDWLPSPGVNPVTGKPTRVSDWLWHLDHDPFMVAAGAIVGLRVTISMILGGIVLYYGIGIRAMNTVWISPKGEALRAISDPAAAWKEAGLWFGVAILVAAGLTSFALQWRTIVRAFRGFAGRRSSSPADTLLARRIEETEVPMAWFTWGVLVFSAGVIWLADAHFHIPWYYGVLAIAMTFILSLVACRATGETDITPTRALGKIMQLTYGGLIPQNATANLMTASITANAAGNSADLLTDLKGGYLLGANPRRQFMAQFLGVVSGTFATVLGFRIMVPDATALNGVVNEAGEMVRQPAFPAPAARSWEAVARVFRDGFDSMHPMHQQLAFWGLGIGCVLVLMEAFIPRGRRWLPSATGFGMGMIFGFNYAISMFLGALVAWLWSREGRQSHDDYMLPIAAGVIAGSSLMGVVVGILNGMFFSG